MEGLSAALSRQTGLEIVTQEGAAGYPKMAATMPAGLGAPKMLALNHETLARAGEALARACRLAARDRVFLAPSTHGAYPFLAAVFAALGRGPAEGPGKRSGGRDMPEPNRVLAASP